MPIFCKTLFPTVVAFATISIVCCRVVEQSHRWIKLSRDGNIYRHHDSELFDYIKQDVTFLDVTDFTYDPVPDVNTSGIPETIRFAVITNLIFDLYEEPKLRQDIYNLQSLGTRFYLHDMKTPEFLKSHAAAIIEGYGGAALITEVNHGEQGFSQTSIIVTVTGNDPVLKEEIVILGAHMDSISRSGPFEPAPGADDNATGTALLLEILRLLIKSNFRLKKTVEFHWYAAGEVGLRGSQGVAKMYYNQEDKVVGVLNMDSVGYVQRGSDYLGLFQDEFGNPELAAFAKLLVENYVGQAFPKEATCGYACSDHASWTMRGYPALTVGSFITNPWIHTDGDKYENGLIDYDQIWRFMKLGVSYAIEMAEPWQQ